MEAFMAFVSGRKCSREARAGLGFLSPLIPKLTTQIITERGCSEWGAVQETCEIFTCKCFIPRLFLKTSGVSGDSLRKK